MSAIVIDGGLIHYESWGRGSPLILLHGWLGSWRYWMPT
ncbi:MAG: alpha/beta hydrolase, partial [Anaerolineae bacterium]|nr:alpha/beta hydrolase [Anaerolineae bacterium]